MRKTLSSDELNLAANRIARVAQGFIDTELKEYSGKISFEQYTLLHLLIDATISAKHIVALEQPKGKTTSELQSQYYTLLKIMVTDFKSKLRKLLHS